jgi:NitT/TauT family transport system substrate-binding protein
MMITPIQHNIKKFISILLVGILAIALHPTLTGGAEKTKITFSQGLAPVSAPVFIATAKGYWAEEGLDVKVKTFISGKLALDTVIWKKSDVATVAETPVVLAALQGKQVRVICTMAENFLYVIGRKDAGISKPADLKGKRVATLMNTSAHFFMHKYLKTHGLSRPDVKVTNLRPADMVYALIRGDIDAYFMWEPNVYFAKKELGESCIVFSGKDIYVETFNIVVLKEFADQHPDALLKILRALSRAVDFIKDNREESIRITADVIGMEADALNDIWDNYKFSVKLDKSLLQYMKEQEKWTREARVVGKRTKEIDLRTFILSEPLKTLGGKVMLEQDKEEVNRK